MSPNFRIGGARTRRDHTMTIDDDKTTSDNIKVPKFDHSNKMISRDTKIKVYTQSFKCAAMTKYGTKDRTLFQTLVTTKTDATPPSLRFAKKDKITKVTPAFTLNRQHVRDLTPAVNRSGVCR
jgi:hypothetical protein